VQCCWHHGLVSADWTAPNYHRGVVMFLCSLLCLLRGQHSAGRRMDGQDVQTGDRGTAFHEIRLCVCHLPGSICNLKVCSVCALFALCLCIAEAVLLNQC
jgi:hypothetical protein